MKLPDGVTARRVAPFVYAIPWGVDLIVHGTPPGVHFIAVRYYHAEIYVSPSRTVAAVLRVSLRWWRNSRSSLVHFIRKIRGAAT